MRSHRDTLAARMFAFPAEAAACADMAALAASATAAVALADMTVIASGMLTGPADAGVFHFHNWPEHWLALYRERGFLERDPLPRWALASGVPARWTEIAAQLPPNDPGREIMSLVAVLDLKDGLVVPVRSAAGHLGLVSVGGPAAVLENEACHYLQVVCTACLHRAEALREAAQPRLPLQLSRRESQCVRLLTEGANEHEIAVRLGISEATVRFHIDNAREKTGARSRTHLAGVAGQWLNRAADGLKI